MFTQLHTAAYSSIQRHTAAYNGQKQQATEGENAEEIGDCKQIMHSCLCAFYYQHSLEAGSF